MAGCPAVTSSRYPSRESGRAIGSRSPRVFGAQSRARQIQEALETGLRVVEDRAVPGQD